MDQLPDAYWAAVKRITLELEDQSIEWALTGSANFALQGVPVSPNDIDIQTTEDGAYKFADIFSDCVKQPVSFSEGEGIRSHFGVFEFEGLQIEIMGAVEKRDSTGVWQGPVSIQDNHEYVTREEIEIPVLSLSYEANAYEQLGRHERAALLKEHAENAGRE